jgi:phage gpG-like protein
MESVEVNAEQLTKLMSEIQLRGRNTGEVMRAISVMLVEEVDDNFETSGHGTWPPYAESTRRSRGDIDAAKMLIDTGRLAASITGDHTQTEASAYTNVEYAKYHVSPKPRNVIPLRDFFDIDTPAVLNEAIELLLVEVVR